MKINVSSCSQKFMKIHDVMKRTTACTATFFKRELMVLLFTLPPLFWELQHLKFSPHELFPPWWPFESPRPKRICAATHCRTIAPSGFHSLPHFIELQLCFQVACPRSNLFFSLSRSRFYGAKRSLPGDAVCWEKAQDQTHMTKLTSATTHRRNSNNWDFMILLNSDHTCSRQQRNRLEAAKFHDFVTS